MENNNTLNDIRNEVWRLLGQKSTSLNFTSHILNLKINNTLDKIWKGEVINILNPKEIINSGDLYFQNNIIELPSNGSGLIMLPDDFSKLISVESNYPINENDIQLLDKNRYLLILKNGNNKSFKIKYIKNCNRLINDDDICELPSNYSMTVLAPLVAGILAYESNMPMSTTLLTLGYTNLKEMYFYFNEKIKNNPKKIVAKSYNFKSVR